MLSRSRFRLAVLAVGLACAAAPAQQPAAPTPAPQPPQGQQPAAPPPPAPPTKAALPPPPPPPAATAVAATVNDRPIMEMAVYRATMQYPPGRRDEMRKEVVNFLVENALIDQYLEQLKVTVEAPDIEKRLKEVKDEIVKGGLKYPDVIDKLHLTEADLRAQIVGTLRWDKFVAQYATDKALREFLAANLTTFDGSQVRARHLLIACKAGDAKAADEAKAKILGFKKQIEEQVAAGLKAVAAQDKLAQDKARTKLLEDAFAAAAAKESGCPSKASGGDLGWFPRAGRMVEPFAKAAFALQPYELSDAVPTEYGCHLILVTDRKAGREVKYEEIQEVVKEVYLDRMREAVVARLKPAARIAINPPPKQ